MRADDLEEVVLEGSSPGRKAGARFFRRGLARATVPARGGSYSGRSRGGVSGRPYTSGLPTYFFLPKPLAAYRIPSVSRHIEARYARASVPRRMPRVD
jgi:hypothetical protein